MKIFLDFLHILLWVCGICIFAFFINIIEGIHIFFHPLQEESSTPIVITKEVYLEKR